MKLRDGSKRRGPNTRRRSAKTWETQAGFQRKARAFPCARGGVLPHCCIERGIRHFDSRARIAKASRTAPARAKTDLSDSGDQGSSAVAKLGSAASQITRTRAAASGAIAQMPRKDELIRSSCARQTINKRLRVGPNTARCFTDVSRIHGNANRQTRCAVPLEFRPAVILLNQSDLGPLTPKHTVR